MTGKNITVRADQLIRGLPLCGYYIVRLTAERGEVIVDLADKGVTIDEDESGPCGVLTYLSDATVELDPSPHPKAGVDYTSYEGPMPTREQAPYFKTVSVREFWLAWDGLTAEQKAIDVYFEAICERHHIPTSMWSALAHAVYDDSLGDVLLPAWEHSRHDDDVTARHDTAAALDELTEYAVTGEISPAPAKPEQATDMRTDHKTHYHRLGLDLITAGDKIHVRFYGHPDTTFILIRKQGYRSLILQVAEGGGSYSYPNGRKISEGMQAHVDILDIETVERLDKRGIERVRVQDLRPGLRIEFYSGDDTNMSEAYVHAVTYDPFNDAYRIGELRTHYDGSAPAEYEDFSWYSLDGDDIVDARLEPCNGDWYVTRYRVSREYGGPEEGGWHYDHNEIDSAWPAPDRLTEDELFAYARELNASEVELRGRVDREFRWAVERQWQVGEDHTLHTPRYC
jgi:hypothetical protein